MLNVVLILFNCLALSCSSQIVEDSIVLINVGNYDKGRIGRQIEAVKKLGPEVIALDIAFPEYENSEDDSILVSALWTSNNLVLASAIRASGEDYHGKKIISVGTECSPEFIPHHAKFGFINAEVESGDLAIPDRFILKQVGYTGHSYYHFSLVTAMQFDSLKAAKFVDDHRSAEKVVYKGGNRKFKRFSSDDVLKGKLTRRDIEGKVVMFGFLGPGNADKYFSQSNINSQEPDMYGLEYLANIVAQILE